MKRFLALAALAGLSFITVSSLLAQEPVLGTWKLNLAKSNFNPGPLPKSVTRTVEAQGDKVKYSFRGTAADGTALAYTFTVAYDGKDYPITGSGAPGGADTIAITKLSSTSFEATMKKAGEPVFLTKVSIAKDGKTTTLVQTNLSGNIPVKNTSVYDKQ
jgi:hypothetical protein